MRVSAPQPDVRGLRSDIGSGMSACSQCGAYLLVAPDAGFISCSWCHSTLRPTDDSVLYVVGQREQISRSSAREAFLTWCSGRTVPADLRKQINFEVGGLSLFPFLIIRRDGSESAAPLSTVPCPEIMQLARVPAEMIPLGPEDDPGLADPQLLATMLAQVGRDSPCEELRLEYRAYYPVEYSYQGERYHAIVDGSLGRIICDRHPVRRTFLGDRAVALAPMVILLGEALVLPGLWTKLAAITCTAVVLFLGLRLLMLRRG